MRLSAKFAALGMTMATVSGTGMFAITADDAETDANTIQSNTYATAAHDIGITRVSPQSTACPTTTSGYDADDVIPAEFTGNAVSIGGSVAQATAFCVRNNTTAPVDLRVGLRPSYFPSSSQFSREVGACAASESAAGDASCADGQPGELGTDDFRYDINVLSGSTSGCNNVSNAIPINDVTSPANVTFGLNLGVGGVCKIWLNVKFLGASSMTENDRHIVQTDSFNFKFVFRGSDAGPT